MKLKALTAAVLAAPCCPPAVPPQRPLLHRQRILPAKPLPAPITPAICWPRFSSAARSCLAPRHLVPLDLP